MTPRERPDRSRIPAFCCLAVVVGSACFCLVLWLAVRPRTRHPELGEIEQITEAKFPAGALLVASEQRYSPVSPGNSMAAVVLLPAGSVDPFITQFEEIKQTETAGLDGQWHLDTPEPEWWGPGAPETLRRAIGRHRYGYVWVGIQKRGRSGAVAYVQWWSD